MSVRIVIPGDEPPLVTRSKHWAELRALGDVRWWPDTPPDVRAKRERVHDAEILLNSRGSLPFSGDDLRAMPHLKMIAVCGVGYDSIDLDSARELGVTVCNVQGQTAEVVAEHAFALMLATARRVVQTTNEIRAGVWSEQLNQSLVGRSVGIIGTGNIGCRMADFCRGFGMTVKAWSFHPDPAKAAAHGLAYCELDQLLSDSDVISVHVRLSDESRGLIGRREFDLLPPHALVINTSRGGVIDYEVLTEFLQAGRISGAGLDVFPEEPLPAGHPITNCPNVTLTPHSADQNLEGIDALTRGCIRNIEAWLQGNPQNVIV